MYTLLICLAFGLCLLHDFLGQRSPSQQPAARNLNVCKSYSIGFPRRVIVIFNKSSVIFSKLEWISTFNVEYNRVIECERHPITPPASSSTGDLTTDPQTESTNNDDYKDREHLSISLRVLVNRSILYFWWMLHQSSFIISPVSSKDRKGNKACSEKPLAVIR